MIQTVDIFKAIVATLTANCVIDSVVSNGDGTFTISTSNTHWISEFEVYTIGGFDYKIEEITQNVSLKIRPVNGGPIPNVAGFVIPAPLFFNGTLKMAQNEVDNFKDKMELVPFVYLYEVIRDRKNTDEESTIERECDLRFFFINSSSFKDMLTEDIYEKVIYPLHPLVELFIAKLKNSPLFTDVLNYDEINLLNFSEEGNQNKSIFDLNLSAIELRLQAEIRSVNCDDIIVNPNPTCLPARITDGSEVVEVASGSEYTCQSSICADATYDIKDTDTNVLYSGSIVAGGNLDQEIQNSTVNVRKSDNVLINAVSVLAEGSTDEIIPDSRARLVDTDGNPISQTVIKATDTEIITAPDGIIEINGTQIDTVTSGGTKNIAVQYENGMPVGTIVGGVVEIPDPPEAFHLATALHEFYRPNITDVGDTVTQLDTGSVGGLDLANPNPLSKPTVNNYTLSYDGVAQYLEKVTSNFRSGDATGVIHIKFKATDNTNNKLNLLFSVANTSTLQQFRIFYRNLKIRTTFDGIATPFNYETTSAITLNSINTFTVFSDSSSVKFALNGVLVAKSNIAGVDIGQWFSSLILGTDNIVLGAINGNTGLMYGKSDEYGFWYENYTSEANALANGLDIQNNAIGF